MWLSVMLRFRGDAVFEPPPHGSTATRSRIAVDAGAEVEEAEMRKLIFFFIVTTTLAGCALNPTDAPFTRAMDRAYAVGCDIKSLEWTQQRSRLECHD